MPNRDRARHARLMLRFSKDMEETKDKLYVDVEAILKDVATENDATCTTGELRAASRYLASSLAEYYLRKKKGIPDARHDPEDEALWREDLVLRAKKTAPSEATKKFHEKPFLTVDVSSEQIALAREIRKEARQALRWKSRSEGGSRYAIVNAIRHAWLICHDGNDDISYGRQTDKHSDHVGPLHDFIEAVLKLIPDKINTDELHRKILALDKEIHPTEE